MPVPAPREFVDRNTGQLVRIETTKTAKARYRKSSGQQWTPTRGQINAADLWNKQEEQLRKQREREEKKKKNATRQAEKDARQREIQQEMLRKGRITMEDTWGKINASQNRLHKFFGPTHCHSAQEDSTIDDGEHERLPESTSGAVHSHSESEDEATTDASLEHGEVMPEAQSCQPLNRLPDCDKQSSQISPLRSSSSQCQIRIDGQTRKDHKRKRDSEQPGMFVSDKSISYTTAPRGASHFEPPNIPMEPSQLLMPPPPPPPRRVNAAHPGTLRDQPHEIQLSPTARSQPSPKRVPLATMSASQLNSRCNEKPDPDATYKIDLRKSPNEDQHLLSTQVFNETLGGLSSQDLEDDLAEDDKENSSPLRRILLLATNEGKSDDCSRNVTNPDEASPSQDRCTTTPLLTYLNEDDDIAEEEYDDIDIDDELLVTLAATQQVQRHPCNTSLVSGHENLISADSQKDTHDGIRMDVAQHMSIPQSISSDSFTFSDIEETDLVECIDKFEDHAEGEEFADADLVSFMEKFEQSRQLQPSTTHKKRQALPWVKFPVPTSSPSIDINPSQQTEVLED